MPDSDREAVGLCLQPPKQDAVRRLLHFRAEVTKALGGSRITIYESERAGGSQSSMRVPFGSLIHAKWL